MPTTLPTADLVLDVAALADILAQYFNADDRSQPHFQATTDLTLRTATMASRIVEEDTKYVVAASVLAFVEMAHRWDRIVDNRFSPVQLAAFLLDPPEWFSIEPMEEELIGRFADIPSEVQMPDGRIEPIEWTDAIHAATTLNREQALLVTSDRRLRQVPGLTLT